jgi:hypothetical protein
MPSVMAGLDQAIGILTTTLDNADAWNRPWHDGGG